MMTNFHVILLSNSSVIATGPKSIETKRLVKVIKQHVQTNWQHFFKRSPGPHKSTSLQSGPRKRKIIKSCWTFDGFWGLTARNRSLPRAGWSRALFRGWSHTQFINIGGPFFTRVAVKNFKIFICILVYDVVINCLNIYTCAI